MRFKTCSCCCGIGTINNIINQGLSECQVCYGTGQVIAEDDSINTIVTITIGKDQKFFGNSDEFSISRKVFLMNKTTGKIDYFSHVFTEHVEKWINEKKLGWDDGKKNCPNWCYELIDDNIMIINYPRDQFLLMIRNEYFDWYNPFQINIQYIFYIENQSIVGEMLELISNKLEWLSKNYAAAVPLSVLGKENNQFYITNYTFHNVLGAHWRQHILNVENHNLYEEHFPDRLGDNKDGL